MSNSWFLFIMGLFKIIKPINSNAVDLDEQMCDIFSVVGWLEFIHKFHGHRMKATKAFAQSFDGTIVQVGDHEFSIIEEFIAQATGLVASGERWHKHNPLKKVPWKKLLKKPVKAQEYTKGMPLSFFKALLAKLTCSSLSVHYMRRQIQYCS